MVHSNCSTREARFDPYRRSFSHPDPSQIRQIFIEEPSIPGYSKIYGKKVIVFQWPAKRYEGRDAPPDAPTWKFAAIPV
jgi:hypothetical protein